MAHISNCAKTEKSVKKLSEKERGRPKKTTGYKTVKDICRNYKTVKDICRNYKTVKDICGNNLSPYMVSLVTGS